MGLVENAIKKTQGQFRVIRDALEEAQDKGRGRSPGCAVDDDAPGADGQQGKEGRRGFHGIPEKGGERVYETTCGVWRMYRICPFLVRRQA